MSAKINLQDLVPRRLVHHIDPDMVIAVTVDYLLSHGRSVVVFPVFVMNGSEDSTPFRQVGPKVYSAVREATLGGLVTRLTGRIRCASIDGRRVGVPMEMLYAVNVTGMEQAVAAGQVTLDYLNLPPRPLFISLDEGERHRVTFVNGETGDKHFLPIHERELASTVRTWRTELITAVRRNADSGDASHGWYCEVDPPNSGAAIVIAKAYYDLLTEQQRSDLNLGCGDHA